MIIDVLKILVGGFIVLPVAMFLGVHLLIFWLAGMNWCAKKFDKFMYWLIWRE